MPRAKLQACAATPSGGSFSALLQRYCAEGLLFLPVVVQRLSPIRLFVTLWTAAHQAFLSFTISCSLLKFMSTESMMLSNHLILCRPLLLLPSIFASIRVCSKESAVCIRWPKYWTPVPGILQARILEWVVISFSRGPSRLSPRRVTAAHNPPPGSRRPPLTSRSEGDVGAADSQRAVSGASAALSWEMGRGLPLLAWAT